MRMRSRPMPAVIVLRNDAAGLRDGGLGVVGEAGVYFGGNAAGNDGQDFFAEGNGQPLEGEVGDGWRRLRRRPDPCALRCSTPSTMG